MREKFHNELAQLVDGLGELLSLAENAMRQATVALLDADERAAGLVIDGDGVVAARQADLDAVAVDLLARQQPVATDLRTIIACLRMSVDVRRMGKLAVHVAEIARAHPAGAVPAALRPVVTAMAECAQRIVAAAGRAIVTRDAAAAVELDHADDELDRLYEQLYRTLFHQPLGVEEAVDAALVGRYYERYADHAVSLARRLAYVAGLNTLDTATEERGVS